MDYQDRITMNPLIRSGKPTIRGMRITVADLLGWLASGMANDEILLDYPELTLDDIYTCLAYAADAVSRARFVDSVQRGLAQTAAGLVTEDDAFWEELDRESKD